MKTIYECNYCVKTFTNRAECKQHEIDCNNNPKNYKYEKHQCDDNCWYAKTDHCFWNEHCHGEYLVKIDTRTGKIIET
jgi:hypothetical protein